MIEIMNCYTGRWRHKANLDKVEINKMEKKEDEDNDTSMEHILRKEGCVRVVAACVCNWSRPPILERDKQPENDMEQKSGEEHNLKNLDERVGSHESRSLCEHTASIIFQQHKIDAEMHT